MRDSALEAFDGLRLREVRVRYEDTASTFLARFRSTAAELGPDERIQLELVVEDNSGMELVKAVFNDQHASKICALGWEYGGEEDVDFAIPLLLNKCPELASLWVELKHHSSFDFVAGVLEHPGNTIKVLEMPPYAKGDLPRFFAALAQSQVSALTISGDGSPEFFQGLCDYLAKDLLVRLEVWMDHKQMPSELMVSLAKCTRLTKLELTRCSFSQPTAFPKSITKLLLHDCAFGREFDWSFLVDSNVRELDFKHGEVDGSLLGSALSVHLRGKGLDELCIHDCRVVDETLAVVGVEIGRITRLDIDRFSDASIALIALALESPNNEMKELKLEYHQNTMSTIETCFGPALKHSNCHLAKLSLSARQPELGAAAGRVERQFYHRRALFVLLQGQQVRRVYCPLWRLPVEMFRLVGQMLN